MKKKKKNNNKKKNSYASKNLLKEKRKDYRFRKEHHLAITDPTKFLRSVRGEPFFCLLSTKEPRLFVLLLLFGYSYLIGTLF